MYIQVIDKDDQRKAELGKALIRAGWLVASPESGSLSNIIIDLSADVLDLQDYQDTKNMVLISTTEKPQHDFREVQTIPLEVLPDTNRLIAYLLAAVAVANYRHFYPITRDSGIRAMLATAKKAAVSSASVMIEGETGTGKEVIAKYIHYHSHYAKGPFVAVNCAAIPESMIEAELFGYEKGAFTNAINSHAGKFERANHGSLFLDEIGEMSLDVQAKLLRVLQLNEFERIGGKDTIKVDLRVIAATNKNMALMTREGLFRPDLYYRLNVIPIKCLPLRERACDIAILSDYFLQLYTQELDKKCKISSDALIKLQQYVWPGNVRELQNTIQRAVIMNETGVIEASDIELEGEDRVGKLTLIHERTSLRANEAETIVKVLKETNGCRRDAARLLNISPRTLRYKISRLKESGLVVP